MKSQKHTKNKDNNPINGREETEKLYANNTINSIEEPYEILSKGGNPSKSLNPKGKKLNQFEHVLQRSDMYIGSLKTIKKECYVLDFNSGKVIYKEVIYNNALQQIYREIGSNCIDNGWRSEGGNTPMTLIEITWDGNFLTFWNDGNHISAEKDTFEHKDHKTGNIITEIAYPAEIYFGEMLAGTNFDKYDNNGIDKQTTRKTSGRNGVGSCCCNIFSEEFQVIHYDPITNKTFSQTYTNNANHRTEPVVTKEKGKSTKGWTQIKFKPDFKRFEYDIKNPLIEEDFISILGLYALEIAAVSGKTVKFNVKGAKKTYNIKSFDKYVRLFYPDTTKHKLGLIKLRNGDECVVIESHTDANEKYPEQLDEVQQFSFVNGVRTKNGGIHLNAWRDLIFPKFTQAFNSRKLRDKEKASLKTTAKEVYPYIHLFLRCEINMPEFDYQTKDVLVGPEYTIIPKGKLSKIEKEYAEQIKSEVDDLVGKMLKWNFIELLETKLLAKTGKTSKTSKITRNIGNKLMEANKARNHEEPEKCILWITEGLSALELIRRGRTHLVDGHEYHGGYALKGKLLNVSSATRKELLSNEEILDLISILNLEYGVDYSIKENLNKLRYHTIRITTDADDDGIHIRGLVINFFLHYWKELFDIGVIDSFSTGVAKVTLSRGDPFIFYSNSDIVKWLGGKIGGRDCNIRNDVPHIEDVKVTDIKYLKGLASINKEDVSFYFNNIKKVDYYLEGDEKEYISLGFDGTQEARNLRKKWVTRDMKPYEDSISEDNNDDNDPTEKTITNNENIISNKNALEITENGDISEISTIGTSKEDTRQIEYVGIGCNDEEDEDVYVYDGRLGVSTFIDRTLVIYHRMALGRALPNKMDGLKEGQRKILYAIRKQNHKKTQDLEKVSGYIKTMTQYHHGGVSLIGTIGNMVVSHPGSNNIALLVEDGEFGTRYAENKGQGRYIHTKLENVAKYIFPIADDPLCKKRKIDNKLCEYEVFYPIIPMLLVNGAMGIATGFSSTVYNYNPTDLITWIHQWLAGNEEKHMAEHPLVPWYRGITGPISLNYKKGEKYPESWHTEGVLEKCRGKGCPIKTGKKACNGELGWWHVTDLPVGMSTTEFNDYLKYLETGIPPVGKKWKKLEHKCIAKLSDYSTANMVHFKFKPSRAGGGWDPDMDDTLKCLKANRSLKNMVCVDNNDYPTRYKSAEDIMKEYCPKRLKIYKKRKIYQLNVLKHEIEQAENKYKFVKAVVDKKLEMHQKKEKLYEDMKKLGLKMLTTKYIDDNYEEEEEKDEEDDIQLEDIKKKTKKEKNRENNNEEDENNEETNKKKDKVKKDPRIPSYDYLAGMKIWSMTVEKLDKLKESIEIANEKIKIVKAKTPSDMWRDDIKKLEPEIQKYYNSRKLT